MVNSYTSFINEYDNARKKRSAEMETFGSKLLTAEVKRNKAQADVDKAARGNSEATFRTAKVKLIECEADVEYYQGKINEVENSPLFDVSNESKLDEIRSIQVAIENEAIEKIKVPLTEAYNIAAEAFNQIRDLNEIAGEISGKGLNYYSEYYFRPEQIKGLRDYLFKFRTKE